MTVAINNTPEQNLVQNITLSVSGVIITGKIISKQAFYGEKINLPLKNIEKAKEIAAKEFDQKIEEPDLENMSEVYLKEAFYITGSQKIPSIDGLFLAVSIDSIDSYSLVRVG